MNQVVTSKDSDWNVGEFFILARYQGHSIGKSVAEKLWEMHPGKWEVSVIPENISALIFWEKTICEFTNNDFIKEIKQHGRSEGQLGACAQEVRTGGYGHHRRGQQESRGRR